MSALRDAIVTALKADAPTVAAATGGIWPGLPPKGAATAYPFITVTAQRPPKPERVFRGGGTPADGIAFEAATYLVKAVDKNTSPKRASDLNALIRTALDGQTITVTGYTLISLLWAGDVSYSELDDSTHYQHEGGLYEIWANKS
jgi:hypothetical protein